MMNVVQICYQSRAPMFRQLEREFAVAFVGALIAAELTIHNTIATLDSDEDGSIVVNVRRP